MNILRAQVVLSFVGALLMAGCGSSSSGGDPVALCKQRCTKYLALCLPDAGELGATAKALCESGCTSPTTTGTTCSNASAISTAYKACLQKTTCDELTTCSEAVPVCVGGGSGGASGGGTGGSTGAGTGGRSGAGTGGSTGAGTGGSTGSGGCAALLACCDAASDPAFKSACMQQYAAVMAAGDALCNQVLTAAKPTYCPTL